MCGGESGEASREKGGTGRKTKEIVETRPSGHWPGLIEEKSERKGSE